jgi:hypothetical protein
MKVGNAASDMCIFAGFVLFNWLARASSTCGSKKFHAELIV